MKLLRLAFQNIHSFEGPFEIDFEAKPLKNCGLFVIVGATGAGKTTLLDAITLALFRRTARLGEVVDRHIEEQGGILSHLPGVLSCFCEVDYEAKGVHYRSYWGTSKTKTGRLKPYEMRLTNLSEQKIIDIPRREIPQKNSELIGLDPDQFLKSVILSQGAFAEFLQAKDEEKSRLLEKLTGGALYRQLGILAFEKKKEAQFNCDTVKNQLEGILLFSDHELQEAKERKAFLKKSTTEKKKRVEAIQKLQIFQDQENALKEKLEIKRKALPPLQTKKEGIEHALHPSLDLLKKLEKEEPLLLKKVQTARSLNTEIEFTEDQYTKNQTEINKLEAQLNKLNSRKTSEKNLLDRLQKEIALLEKISQLPDPSQALAVAAPIKGFLNQTQTEMASLFAPLREKKPNLSMQQDFELGYDHFRSDLKNQFLSEQTASSLEELKKQKDILLLESSLSDKRALLKEDTPCFLCGSLHHPYSAAYPEIFEKKLKQINLQIEEEEAKALVLKLLEISKQHDASFFELKKALEPFHLSREDFQNGFENTLKKQAAKHQETLKQLNQQKDRLELLSHSQVSLSASIKEINLQVRQKKKGGEKAEAVLKRLKEKKSQAFACFNPDEEEKKFKAALKKQRVICDQLKKEKETINLELKESETLITSWDKELQALSKKMLPFSAFKDFNFEEEKKNLQNLTIEAGRLSLQLQEDREKRKIWKTYSKELVKQEDELKGWSSLALLIGDREGKKFSRFAQTLTFNYLIQLANFHLSKFSPRYRLTPSQKGLKLLVSDAFLGGKIRYAETLSGGETFLVSLSLSLALADLASSGGSIQTLFIDEGFGTLDEESLEEALSALETLQGQTRKTIGMISHLVSIKDRVPTQIAVKQGEGGKSTIKVLFGSEL